MRKKWFQGLALTLGVTTIPSFAAAQYTSEGLAASSFNATALQHAPANNSSIRNYMSPPHGQTSLAAYSQNSAIGSGVPGDHVHIPGLSIDSSVLNSQYQSAPTYAEPAIQPYEQSQKLPSPHATQPNYAAPQLTLSPNGTSSCPACNAGNCATHGVGVASSPMASSIPGYGGAESSYGQSSISYGPAIVSPNPWIFGASGLLFNRVDNQYVRLTSNPASPDSALLSTTDARMEATGGFQTMAGRYFCDGRYALIGSYWGIFSNPQTAAVQAPAGGSLRSNLPFTLRGPGAGSTPYGIEMPGQYVYDWYDGAFAHRVVRDQQFHNVELNFFSFALGGGARQPYAADCGTGGGLAGRLHGRGGLGGGYASIGPGSCGDSCGPSTCTTSCGGPTGPCAPWYGAQCSKLRLNMYGGVRWFRFQDSFEYAASDTDTLYGTTADDFYYRNGVTNDLVGFQLGSLATWCTGTCLNFFAGTAFGVYGNHITADTYAGTTDTAATILSTNSFNGRAYDYNSSESDVALLGEGTLGTGVRLSRGWTANLGYRVVGVSGVATAVGQIPRDFTLGNDINNINNNNSLILHGVVLGAAYNF